MEHPEEPAVPALQLGRHPRRYDANGAATAGLAAGAIAGGLLALTVAAIDLFMRGRAPWTWLLRVAATFIDTSTVARGYHGPTLLVGALAHAGLSLAFGLAFGLVAFSWQRATVIWAGVLWGLLVYAFMLTLALPVVNPPLLALVRVPVAALLHVGFGLVTGLVFERLRFRSSAPSHGRLGATLTIEPQPPTP